MKRIVLTLITLFFTLLPLNAEEKPTVTVSIVPLKSFVEKIAGDRVTVNIMVLPGHSPATYEPKPSQMRGLSDSLLYFSVGVPFEKAWLSRFADQNPAMRIVPTQQGLELLTMASHRHHDDEEEHDHDDHHDHHADHDHDTEHVGKDPHVWLSPANVRIMAGTILENLVAILPEQKDVLTKNYRAFLEEIDATDRALSKILAPFQGEAFMVFHPSWGYLARDYGLKQLPIEIEGKEPSPARLGAFIREAKHQRVRAIFVQPEFSKKAANVIAGEAGVNVVSVSSLAPDWSANLLRFARTFGTKGGK